MSTFKMIPKTMTKIAFATGVALAFTAARAEATCIYEQSLTGENLQVGTMLTWSTAFEEDNALFVVEKSEDGNTFFDIGTLEGAGLSEELRDYNFLDVMANSERTFYRLKQVDTDGSFSYSEVVAVPQVYTNNFMVARMSNVATSDYFELTFDSTVEGDMDYAVSNLRGEVVLRDELVVVPGLNDVRIDLTSQEEGIYKLALTLGDETETLVLKRVTDEIARRPNVASAKRVNVGRN